MSSKQGKIPSLNFLASIKVPENQENTAPGLIKQIIKNNKEIMNQKEFNELDFDEKLDNSYRISILGDDDVGKSSIIKRFCKDEFNNKNNHDGMTKYINHNGPKQLEIRGHRNRELRRCVKANPDFHYAHCIIIACDMTNKESIKNLPGWIETLRCMRNESKLLIAFTKCDAKNEWVKSENELNKMVDTLGFTTEDVFFTSANDNLNIESLFSHATKAIYDKNNEEDYSSEDYSSEDSEEYIPIVYPKKKSNEFFLFKTQTFDEKVKSLINLSTKNISISEFKSVYDAYASRKRYLFLGNKTEYNMSSEYKAIEQVTNYAKKHPNSEVAEVFNLIAKFKGIDTIEDKQSINCAIM